MRKKACWVERGWSPGSRVLPGVLKRKCAGGLHTRTSGKRPEHLVHTGREGGGGLKCRGGVVRRWKVVCGSEWKY